MNDGSIKETKSSKILIKFSELDPQTFSIKIIKLFNVKNIIKIEIMF